MRTWLLGLALGSVSCGESPDADSPAATAKIGAGPRAALDEDRRQLADGRIHPVRDGMTVDEERLRGALRQLQGRHGPRVAAAWNQELEALPHAAAPADPEFTEVAVFAPPDQPAAHDAEALNWLLDPDVRTTAKRWLSTYLTLAMVEGLGFSTRQIGMWMALLRAAEPTLRRCGDGTPGGHWLCVGYGDDVFVLEMRHHAPAWTLARLRWMQRRSAD
ncbi:MAG: hypothetical protein K0V04_14510 [Deltaproteobacteria bacterium]|nr:hypothetical protein [Deltaproteobacteria bacterium]